MKIDFRGTKIYIRPGATDLRKGSEGLVTIIRNEMKKNQYENSVFIFCNKSRKTIKAIWWERNGYWIATKKLQEQTWPWPKDSKEAKEIEEERMQLILKGIDVWKEHKELKLDL